jgi:hypothetical protein
MSAAVSKGQENRSLFVQMAWRRLRQQAIDSWLTQIGTQPNAVRRELGGELWLLFTWNACKNLRDSSELNLPVEQLIEEVQADLVDGCHLILEKDKKNATGPSLKINSRSWFLRVKPGNPAWAVVSINAQQSNFSTLIADLPWRLKPPPDPEDDGYDFFNRDDPTPLPIWLLARADWRDRDALPENPNWVPREKSKAEMLQIRQLAETRASIASATRDLREAFELLEWDRSHRERIPLPGGSCTGHRNWGQKSLCENRRK